MATAAFSEDGKYYSAISADGRLKVWDTETNRLKQEYTPDLHLSAPPSCLQWITASQSAGHPEKQGKKRASASEHEIQCIALGSTQGRILIYSVGNAKIETVLQYGKDKVSSLDWNRRFGFYSCSKDVLVEWDLRSAKFKNKYSVDLESKSKQGNHISAIKIVPHTLGGKAHYVVTASWQVCLWQLHNGTATSIKTLGHSASQTALLSIARHKDHCWLIQGSQNERLLSFWDVTITEDTISQVNGDEATPNKKKRRKSLSSTPTAVITPSYNFVLEDAPRIVDVELKDEDGSVQLRLAAATRSGVVHYYGHMLNGSSVKPHKPSVTIQATTPEAVPLPLRCCRLQPSGDVLLGYNNDGLLFFENVMPDLKTKTQVLIRGGTLGKKNRQMDNATKVRSDVNNTEAILVEPMGGVTSRKRMEPGQSIQVPMEARLANLSLDVKSQGAANENLTRLLMQGLQSGDKHILQMVLARRGAGGAGGAGGARVARRTLGALPPAGLPPLLRMLLPLAAGSTARCAALATWLAALARQQAALLSQPGLPLAPLLAALAHRRSHLCQLMNLKGRIDLTLKQRRANRQAPDHQAAVLDYNDSTSEEEDMIEKYKSDSEEFSDDEFNSDQENDNDVMDQDDDSQDTSDDDDKEG